MRGPAPILILVAVFLCGVFSGAFTIRSTKPEPAIHWEQKDVPCVDGEFGTYGFYLETSKGNTRRWTISLKCQNGEAQFKVAERKL